MAVWPCPLLQGRAGVWHIFVEQHLAEGWSSANGDQMGEAVDE